MPNNPCMCTVNQTINQVLDSMNDAMARAVASDDDVLQPAAVTTAVTPHHGPATTDNGSGSGSNGSGGNGSADRASVAPHLQRPPPGAVGMKRLIQLVNDFVCELDVPRPPHLLNMNQPNYHNHASASSSSSQLHPPPSLHTTHSSGAGDGKRLSLSHTQTAMHTQTHTHLTHTGAAEGHASEHEARLLGGLGHEQDGRASPTGSSVASSLTHVGV